MPVRFEGSISGMEMITRSGDLTSHSTDPALGILHTFRANSMTAISIPRHISIYSFLLSLAHFAAAIILSMSLSPKPPGRIKPSTSCIAITLAKELGIFKKKIN